MASQPLNDLILIDDVSDVLMGKRPTTDGGKQQLATDMLAFNKAKKSGDMDTIREIARRYRVKAPTAPTPQPEPRPTKKTKKDQNGATDDSVAPAWFATFQHDFGATNKKGQPTKAASKESVDKLGKSVKQLKANQAQRSYSWIPALIILAVGIVLFVGILSFGGGMTWAAGAVSLAAAIALGVFIFTNRHNR